MASYTLYDNKEEAILLLSDNRTGEPFDRERISTLTLEELSALPFYCCYSVAQEGDSCSLSILSFKFNALLGEEELRQCMDILLGHFIEVTLNPSFLFLTFFVCTGNGDDSLSPFLSLPSRIWS